MLIYQLLYRYVNQGLDRKLTHTNNYDGFLSLSPEKNLMQTQQQLNLPPQRGLGSSNPSKQKLQPRCPDFSPKTNGSAAGMISPLKMRLGSGYTQKNLHQFG